MMVNKRYGIHWFRRDLRIAGNESLRYNWSQHAGRVLGLFCFDSEFLKRADFSHNRFAFFLKTLRQLQSEMRQQGGDLLVVDAAPSKAFPQILNELKRSDYGLPSLVSWGRDYEPFARARDQQIENILQSFQVNHHTERDHLLMEPHEILKDDGGFYQVYSPYFKRWYASVLAEKGQRRIQAQKVSEGYAQRLIQGDLKNIFQTSWKDFKGLSFLDQLEHFESENKKSVTIAIPEAGFLTAYRRLQEFKNRVGDYTAQRDLPFLDGTSQLSLYQKNGSLVSSQILQTVGFRDQQFVKEIAWREFYYSILWHRPDVEASAFLPQYKNIKWQNDASWFQRWCEGTTGFPIVDAGMRQLNTTGWMHNRVRMIVASFLVKDLLIDWRWGENYFMKMLLDGDLAPNNGGWQWAASTGCDPQPYFRIFNPWLQAAKFDPDAEYIKQYVPELRDLPAKIIHAPDAERGIAGYPEPIVDHAVQKTKALQLFALSE
ncbi:cryptochrome/photolyase family protein [Pseudobdellovibrio exovorus]|uniref:Deoxyribodipyrimidine photo-lyase n=1 Tax=Pseudobdellovibrio exovorus JSS TaxID=1184267 RepID=M4V7P9_9BACT|nr:deoxyribodipyrimidine photo-lyase [Pseudobdellovibrio exovorus]AGH95243.1 hypothetical protein A11Q_1027 [Pseudobdellovibrio exovorus JSS]